MLLINISFSLSFQQCTRLHKIVKSFVQVVIIDFFLFDRNVRRLKNEMTTEVQTTHIGCPLVIKCEIQGSECARTNFEEVQI